MTIHPLPHAKKVLIVAPHPDDESFGCGGAIAIYSSKGTDVHLVVISDGENIAKEIVENVDIAKVRRQELENASHILGIKEVRFLGFPDGQLALYKDKIEEKLREIITEINPDIVFTPSPFDHHDDHRAVSEIAIKFLIEGCTFKVAFYEIYGTIRFNTLIDISSVITVKEQAIKSYYYSLMKVPDLYVDSMKGLNKFRSFYARKHGYYEAFWVVSSPLTQSEVYAWLTYGTDDKADKFLSNLRTVDKLLFELSKSYSLLDKKEAQIREVEKAYTASMEQLAALNNTLQDMKSSLIWRFACRYYKTRDVLLPEGSVFRNIYNRLMILVKGR